MDKKKRMREEENEVEIEEEVSGDEEQRLNLPKKSKFRMRAHCNPLAEISIPQYEYLFNSSSPISPKFVDWSLHYPIIYDRSTKENAEMVNNSNNTIFLHSR